MRYLLKRRAVIWLVMACLIVSVPGLGQAPAIRAPAALPVLPTPSQLRWADAEIGVIIHLDINIYAPDTYRFGRRETLPPLQVFNPTRLNTDQWIRSAKAAGAKYAVLVAKHGTGFSLWPTGQHGYNVANTPWKNGKGDIVADFIRSCRKYGLSPGIYCSTTSNTYYGVHNNVFDDPDSVKVYFKMVLGQLTELYSHYGKLFEIWYDGGVMPSSKGGISDEVAQLVLTYQDKAILFQGPAVCQNLIRWVGNEEGRAPYPMWSRTNASTSSNGIAEIKDLNGSPDGRIWCPAESDFPNRRNSAWEGGWLWKAGQESEVLPASELVSRYYSTVGRNTNMLLGMAIDTSGLFPEKDSIAFSEFGKEIKRRFDKSLGEISGSGKELVLNLGRPLVVNQIQLMENMAKGENIRKYVVEAFKDGAWKIIAQGSSVGHKSILQIEPITTAKLRLRILEAFQTPGIRKFSVYDVSTSKM